MALSTFDGLLSDAIRTAAKVAHMGLGRAVKAYYSAIGGVYSIPTSSSYNGTPLEYCAEDTDNVKRRALFALLTTDLKTSSLSAGKSFSSGMSSGGDTNIDPVDFQHWALVVHFEQGNKFLLLEASKHEVTGKLQPYRAEVTREVFEAARKIGAYETSPQELLDKAKSLNSNGTKYELLSNNCQTWLKQLLTEISPYMLLKLSLLLYEMDPYRSSDPTDEFSMESL